jgi:DNA-binding HxlR family transcriptional regulator
VELVGKRWAGAIIWALSERPHFFAELSQAVPGLSDRLLSRRLRELEAEGVVKRSVHAGTPPRVSYALTDKGKALRPAIREPGPSAGTPTTRGLRRNGEPDDSFWGVAHPDARDLLRV